MDKRSLKFIVVESDTKASFDKTISMVRKATEKGLRVSQDYVIRQMIAALIEKMDRAQKEAEQCA